MKQAKEFGADAVIDLKQSDEELTDDFKKKREKAMVSFSISCGDIQPNC